jgi:hypothetical protein
VPITASHSGPLNRSRNDVRRRRVTRSGPSLPSVARAVIGSLGGGREDSEVEARGPALGALVQRRRRAFSDVWSDGPGELERLPVVERQIGPADVKEISGNPPTRQLDRRGRAARHDQPRPGGQQLGEQAQDVDRRSGCEGVHVIDEERDRWMILEGTAEPGGGRPRGDGRPGDRLEDAGIDRSNLMERRR